MPCRQRPSNNRPARWLAPLAMLLIAQPIWATSARGAIASGESTCEGSPLEQLPQRPDNAPGGSEFARRVRGLSGIDRDALVRAELVAGNFPQFLRHLVPVRLRGPQLTPVVTVCVLPDYLAVGNDRDFVLVPMGLPTALRVALRFGFELPTPKIVDAIYEESPIKLHPLPLPASDAMRSTAYFVEHNDLITTQRAAFTAPLGTLTAGHKKDLVLTNRLWEIPGRVAIYGWHLRNHAPIQPLSIVHGARYADYSHGVRLISSTVYVDGAPRRIEDVLAQPTLARLLTDEGPLPRLTPRITMLMTRIEPSTRVISRGSPAH